MAKYPNEIKQAGLTGVKQLLTLSIIAMPSSVVDQIRYDKEQKILTVVFQSGEVYHYISVPYNAYLSFRAARSKGRYLNKYIKGVYPFEHSEH